MKRRHIILLLLLWWIPLFIIGAWDNTEPADSTAWNNAAGLIRNNNDVLETVLGQTVLDGGLSYASYTADVNCLDIRTKGPWHDVRAYGAKGDGSTDDTTAIANAFTAAASGYVYFPAGTYLTDSITVTSQMGIVGAHMTRTVIKLNASQDTDLLVMDTTNWVRVQDLTLDGNKANNASTSYCMTSTTGISNTYERVSFRSGNDGAVRLKTCNDITFNRCWLWESAVGANIGGATTLTCEQINFNNCVIQDNTTYGIQFVSSQVAAVSTVQGCWFEDGATTPTDQIIVDSDDIHIVANKFNVNTVTNSAIRFKTGASHGMCVNNVTHNTGPTYYIVYDSGAFGNVSIGNYGGDPTTSTDNDGRNWILEYNSTTAGAMEQTGRTIHTITSLDNTGTPSVIAGNKFITSGTTAITAFDDGENGQEIVVVARHSITITEGATIVLSGSVNFTMTATDTLTLLYDNGVWKEVARGDNGA